MDHRFKVCPFHSGSLEDCITSGEVFAFIFCCLIMCSLCWGALVSLQDSKWSRQDSGRNATCTTFQGWSRCSPSLRSFCPLLGPPGEASATRCFSFDPRELTSTVPKRFHGCRSGVCSWTAGATSESGLSYCDSAISCRHPEGYPAGERETWGRAECQSQGSNPDFSDGETGGRPRCIGIQATQQFQRSHQACQGFEVCPRSADESWHGWLKRKFVKPLTDFKNIVLISFPWWMCCSSHTFTLLQEGAKICGHLVGWELPFDLGQWRLRRCSGQLLEVQGAIPRTCREWVPQKVLAPRFPCLLGKR